MKKGISVWSFPADYSLEKIFSLAHKYGFDGVEVALSEQGEVSLESTKEDMDRVKALAKKYDIELYSVASTLYFTYSFVSNDEAVRNKAKQICKKHLQVAAWLGCDTILVVPGYVEIAFMQEQGVIPYNVAYDRTLEALNEMKAEAQKQGVVIGVENVWNKFLLSPLEMRDLIDKVNSDYVKSYFDVGNVVRYAFPQHWISILGNRIQKVHIKDYKKEIGTLGGFVPLLEGDTPFKEAMDALGKIGYNDFVTAEVGFNAGEFEFSLKKTSEAMDIILNY